MFVETMGSFVSMFMSGGSSSSSSVGSLGSGSDSDLESETQRRLCVAGGSGSDLELFFLALEYEDVVDVAEDGKANEI